MGDIINAGADLLGFGPASKQAKAVTSAANISADAQREALALQREMFNRNIGLQEPFRQSGLAAQNQLLTLLGIRPEPPGGGGGGGGSGVAGMVADAVSGAVGGGGGGGLNVDPNNPNFGKYARDFGMSDFVTDPGYNFRFTEGQKALERNAAARGGFISGRALKEATRFGQEMGSQEYSNAYNRYLTNRANQLNPLQSLAGVGQTSTNAMGTAGQNFANQANQLGMTNAANQGNLALQRGNIAATQYGNYANVLGNALSKYNFGGGSNTYTGAGQVNPSSGEYMGSLEF
jgi:hypothetical protein